MKNAKWFIIGFVIGEILMASLVIYQSEKNKKIVKDEQIFDVEEEELCPPKRIKDREAARFNTDD